MHKIIKFRSLKNYVAGAYKNALRKIDFPNYKYFKDANRAYSDFFQKLMTVIDSVAACNGKRVKGNTENYFDGEVLEKLRSRDKFFKALKKKRLHINKELYEKVKHNAQKLIAARKQAFFEENFKKVLTNQKNYGIP